MPLFNIGQLSSGVYYDGKQIRPNDSVVPVLLVVDGNGKTASLKGDPITIADVVPPLVLGTLEQTQGVSNYKITPSGLTISDDANGVLKVYHVLATSLLTDATIASIIANPSFVALMDYGFNQNQTYVAGTSPSIVTSAITGVSRVYISTTNSFREIKHGDSIISHVLAVDPNGLKTLKTTSSRRVTDYTAPTFTGFSIGTIAGGSISVSWSSVEDAGDDAINQETTVYVGVYTSAKGLEVGNPSTITSITPTGSERLITITNEATQSVNIGNGGQGGAPLDNATTYHIYAVARDAANNYSTVSYYTATTLDTTDPLVKNITISQTAGNYVFSATGGEISDNISGDLEMYLVMSSEVLSPDNNDADFKAAIESASIESTAKNVNVPYASGDISAPTLTTLKFWNKSTATYTPIGETSPVAPHKLLGYLVVRDAARNIGFFESTEITVADRNVPTISNFAVTQGASDYTFTVAPATRVSDGRNGPLKVYMFVASANVADLRAFVNTYASNAAAAMAKNENFAYSASSGAVAPPALTASKFWDGSAWKDVDDLRLNVGSTSLSAHLVVLDAAEVPNFATVSSVPISDRTAPAFSGTLALTAEGETSIKVAWSSAITDNVGITEAHVYYSTTAPAATTPAGITTWKGLATTYNAEVDPPTSLASASNSTVTGLTAGTTYYAYLCVKDAAGNELNLATSPASVTTPAPVVVAPSAPVTSYVNRYVELPDFDSNTTTIQSVYGASDTAAMQNTFTNSAAKTLIMWLDKPGRNFEESNYGGFNTSTTYLFNQQGMDFHFRILNQAQTISYKALPGIRSEFNTDRINMFIAVTKSADGTIKAYSNISGDAGSGPPLDPDPGIIKNIGALIQESVFSQTPVPSGSLDFTNFGNSYFISKTSAHWKDLIVFPEALTLPQIQALYDRPRHVVDLHGPNLTRVGNVVSKSADSECRVGIPVYLHGKAYFEFDVDKFDKNTSSWGLAETTWLQFTNHLGSESSNGRAISVASNHGGWFGYFGGANDDSRPFISADNYNTTSRQTLGIAVDYDTGHAWWSVNGNYGGFNPVTRVSLTHNTKSRIAQVDPAVDSLINVKRMRYVVIKPYNASTKIYLKSSYAYCPAGFTPFYTGEIQPYSETHMNLRTSAGATWTASSTLSASFSPSLLADDDSLSEFHSNYRINPNWVEVAFPNNEERIVNKIRMICKSDGGRSEYGPDLFKIQGWNASSGSWTDVYVRSVSNGWRTLSRAIGPTVSTSVLEDVFYFVNAAAYPKYRLLATNTMDFMIFTTLDMFYVDPAGVNVVHYESRYSEPMPRFTDTFTDRSTVPRSLSYTGYTMSQSTNVDIVGFPAGSSPIPNDGDFTVMVPIRLAYQTIGAGDRIGCLALGVLSQIRYGDGEYMNQSGFAFKTITLPAMASRWYNNYHVLSIVYTASGTKAKTYLHYYTTDSSVISSVSTPEDTVSSSILRQELKFNWQGSSQPLGSINIRAATMFPSALSETVLTAAAKKILATGVTYYSFVVREKSTGVGGGNNAPGLIAIPAMSWNLSQSLSQSNVVRFRPNSGGALTNLFDNDLGTRLDYDNNSYNIGDELFYFESRENVSSFTITYHRPIYRPGFQIFKNGVLVYTDASVASSSETPSPYTVTYNV